MQLETGGQDRLQRILEELEGAYRTSPLPLPEGPEEAKAAPAPDPRMVQILQELESAYPSNYQLIKPGAIPPTAKPRTGGVLGAAGQAVHTIGAGGWQGLAGWVDMVDKLYDQLLRREYQNRYEAILKAPVPGAEGMTEQQISAAKMKMYEELGPMDEWLKGRKVQLIAKARDALMKQAQAHAQARLPMTENKVLDVARQVYQGLGQAAVDVPIYAMGGPAALPVFGAARGFAESGTAEGAVFGGVEGAMLQNMIHAIGLLPTAVRLPTWFGMGTAITPGGIQERVVGGLTWAGLGLAGKKGDVSFREFIERYPRLRRRVDDRAALNVLQVMASDVTPEIIKSYGGAKVMLDRLVGLKDKFASVMEVFKKTDQDPAALQAMLNNPEMIPLFRELVGVTEAKPAGLPEARPETVAAGAKARFQVTPEGEVVGTKFPGDQLLRIQYREAELGRRMTPEELAAFFEAPEPTSVPPRSAKATKPEAKPKEPEKPATPPKSDMEIQMMTAEEAATADVEDFKRWANPRFRLSYDPTNESDMAAYKDLVKALGLRGDATILDDVSRRLKVPEKKEEPPVGSTPQAPPAPPAPPPAAPPTPTTPAPAAAAPESKPVAKTKARAAITTGKRHETRRPPTDTPMLTWIRRVGGIKLDASGEKLKKGELLDLYDSKKWRRLFRRKGGVNIFKLQEMAIEDGRLKTDEEREFWEAISDEATGRGKYYSDAERDLFIERGEAEAAAGQTPEEGRAQAVDYYLESWLNGKEVPEEIRADLETQVAHDRDATALRRQRSENLKRNEILETMEREGLAKREDIEEFLDDTFYDGNKAREIARDVMDGKLSEPDAKRKLKDSIDDMLVTEFKPEELAAGPAPEGPLDEPWRETLADFFDSRRGGPFELDPVEAKSIHRESVEEALRNGEDVPAEVLKDYPDLTPEPKAPKAGGISRIDPRVKLAEEIADAHNITSLKQAYEYLLDDRSHGDEDISEAAKRTARSWYKAETADELPAGTKADAVKFIEHSLLDAELRGEVYREEAPKLGETAPRASALTAEDTNQSVIEKLRAGMMLFHGKGEQKGQTGAGSFGRGLYYTSSEVAARVYGPVSTTAVTLKNPLILSDAEARRMAEEYGTRKGTPEQRAAAAQALTTDMMTKGHDGLVRVVRGADGEIWEVEVVDYTPYLAKGKPAEAPRVAEEEAPAFSLKQESFASPKAPESTQGTLIEPGKVERTFPSGFDSRGIGTWPDQESMRRDLRPLVTQGWVAEFGETKDGRIWAKLVERKAAGEGELKTGGIKPPEFGAKTSHDPQLTIDDELSGSLPLDKAEPLKSTEGLEVREPEKEPEPDEFEEWYKREMEEYDKAIAATPEGQVKAFKLYITDDTGTARFYGNFPEDARAELQAYAKKKGVEGKVKFGPMFYARAENVDRSKELEVPKDLMDWVAEMELDYEVKAGAREAGKTLFGDEPKGDPEKELFAGLPIPRSIREKAAKLAEKFDVEAMFNRLKAKATGLSVKLYHTRKNREFELAEDAVKRLKGIAKKVNKGKDLSPAEYQRIFVLASKPRAFAALSDAEKARLGPIVRSVRAFFDEYIPRLRKAGVIEDPWPLSAIKRMTREIQDYRERVERGAKNSDALKEKIRERERAIGFLETTGMRYVHIPRYWLEAFFNARPEQAPRVLSELFGKRETLDIEWLAKKLLEDGLIDPTDLDVRRIMLMYAHSAGHKIAIGQIVKDAKHDGLILPAEDAPETWPRLAAQAFPSLKGYRMHPEMLEFMERNYLKPGWKPPQVGAVMGVIKMAQFWNPFNLSQYSLIQTAWTGAVTTPKMPKIFSKAVRDMAHKTPDYWEASYWGAFPDPFSPTFRQASARARTIIGEDPILKRVLTRLNPYHWSLMAAWKMENFFKMASYNHLREKGFSPKESAQLAALAGGDYATLPPSTRKVLNTVLFTPSFTIAMFKAQGEMMAAGAKLMAKPKLLFDKTGDAKYLRQMAKGAVYLAGGLVLKNMLMHKLGYQTDVWGLKWSKEIEDEDGNKRELVVHMAAPDNVIIRYLNDVRLVAKEENKAKAAFNRLTWKLHPMWTTSLEVLSNKRMDGSPVWNPWDTAFEGRKKALVYVTRRLIRIAELLPEEGQGNLSKLKAYKALREDLGKFGGVALGVYSIPYIRSTADRRLMYEMNQMLDIFKQANKATPPKNDAEAEERAEWLQDALEKVRRRIEEIRE